MAIDVHAHCVPDGLIDALARDEARIGVEVPPLAPLLSDLPARIEAMDRMGVRRQLISPFIGLTAYQLDPPAGRRYSRLFNELMAATVHKAPDRLAAFATVPLQSGWAAAGELLHAITQLGMVGVEIATATPNFYLDDKALAPFWEAADDLGCLILIHPNAAHRGREPYFLGNFVGNPAETTMAVARLMFGGILDDYPRIRFCLAHGGGFLPYQLGRLERGYAVYDNKKGARLRSSPRELVGRLYYDTVLHSPEMIRVLIDLVGPRQVLLGSDYPFEMGDLDPLATLATIPGITPADQELISSGNVERLTGETAPTAVRRA
jgi:aminocarboxymuconate-semialdehyde decarboxylase